MRKQLWILAAAIGALACGDGGDVPEGAIGSDTSAAAARQMMSAIPEGMDLGAPALTIAFQQMAPDSIDDEITGTARIYADTAVADTVPDGGGFRLEVVLDGLTPGAHAWHIHTGECEERGPIAVPLTKTATSRGIAGPLEADHGLTARALVTIPGDALTLRQLRARPYSLHVHRGTDLEPGATVVCADLS